MDSRSGTIPASPRAGDTHHARASQVQGGIHAPMLKPPNADPSSRCPGALTTLRAQISWVPRDRLLLPAERSVHKMGFSCSVQGVLLHLMLGSRFSSLEARGAGKCSISDLRGGGLGSSVRQPWGREVVKIHHPHRPRHSGSLWPLLVLAQNPKRHLLPGADANTGNCQLAKIK